MAMIAFTWFYGMSNNKSGLQSTGYRAGVRPRRKPGFACNLLYIVLYIFL